MNPHARWALPLYFLCRKHRRRKDYHPTQRTNGASLPINTSYRPKDGSSTVGCENTITPNEPSEATAKLGVIHTRAFSPRHVFQTAFRLVFFCSSVYKR